MIKLPYERSFSMTVGERIKQLREKLRLSQVDFADKINVSKQTLYSTLKRSLVGIQGVLGVKGRFQKVPVE